MNYNRYYTVQTNYFIAAMNEFLEDGQTYEFYSKILPDKFGVVAEKLKERATTKYEVLQHLDTDELMPAVFCAMYINENGYLNYVFLTNKEVDWRGRNWMLPIPDVDEFAEHNDVYEGMYPRYGLD